MFCQNCGKEFEGNFCPDCGTPAQRAETVDQWKAPVVPEETQTPVMEETEAPSPDLSEPRMQEAKDPAGDPVIEPTYTTGGVTLEPPQMPQGQVPPQMPIGSQTPQQWSYASGQPTQFPGDPTQPIGQQPPKKKHTGLIVGCAVGGGVLILVIVILLVVSFTNSLKDAVQDQMLNGDYDYYEDYSEPDVWEDTEPDVDVNEPIDEGTTSAYPGLPEGDYTVYKSGMYKVGDTMPAGEYLLLANDEWSNSGYYEVTSDTTGELDSIIVNDNFDNRGFVQVEEGTYINLQRCVAIPVDEVPPYEAENGYYPEGTYRVGIDIPAGEYTLSPIDSDISGYYELREDASGDWDKIISNKNFDGEFFLTIKDGQYFTLSLAEIKGE